jgi:hypothetical protein
VKRITRRTLEFTSCEVAQSTLAGIELMPRLKKGQLVGEEGAEDLTPAEQFDALTVSSPTQQSSLRHPLTFATDP